MYKIIKKIIINFIINLLDFVYPPFCVKCDTFLSLTKPYYLCKTCLKNLSWNHKTFCLICGRNIQIKKTKTLSICFSCKTNKRYFNLGLSALNFSNPVKNILYDYKYHKQFGYSKFLATLMIRRLKTEKTKNFYDLVSFVPIHKSKQKQRGFNQSKLIAEFIARHLNKPVIELLLCVKARKQQAKLGSIKRSQNVKNNFKLINHDLSSNQHVLLIDDVMTSGNTFNECSKVIRVNHPNIKITVFSLMSIPQGN